MIEITPEETIPIDEPTPPRKSRRLWWLLTVFFLLAGVVTFYFSNEDNRSAMVFKLKPPITKLNPVDGAVMIWIPAGKFIMGDKNIVSIQDARNVYLDGYWIYRDEVTRGQFAKFCQQTGYAVSEKHKPFHDESDLTPQVDITWYEARAYAKWAGGDLPTGAQWEKAARGTDGRMYPWGNKWDPIRCNCSKAWQGGERLYLQYGGNARPLPAGSSPGDISPYGVRDMAGNVREFTRDLYYSTEDPKYGISLEGVDVSERQKYNQVMNGRNPFTVLPGKKTDRVNIRGKDCWAIAERQDLFIRGQSFALYNYWGNSIEARTAIGIRCVVTGNPPVRR